MAKKREPKKVGSDIYGVKANWKTDVRTGKSAESGMRHSAYYHKYFRGYTEVRVEKPGGKVKVERYYTRPWIVQDVSQRAFVYYRVLYAALGALAIALFCWAAAMEGCSGNRSPVGVAGIFAMVVCLILLFAALLNYLFTRKSMTLWDHHSASENLKRAALASAIAAGAAALLVLLNCLLSAAQAGRELVLALVLLLSGAPCLALFFLEKNMPYREEPNHTALPKGETHEIW